MDIKLNIDLAQLSWGALVDFEEIAASGKLGPIIPWLVEHAGADADELRALPFPKIAEVMNQISQAFSQEVQPPKTKRGRS